MQTPEPILSNQDSPGTGGRDTGGRGTGGRGTGGRDTGGPDTGGRAQGPGGDAFSFLGEEERAAGRYITMLRTTWRAPDGTVLERDVVRHPGAVAVVALRDDIEVLLVRQFRAAIGRSLLELPAGTLDRTGERPELTARRELEEEAGYSAGRITLLGSMLNSPGYCDQQTFIYLAQDIRPCERRPDGAEERSMEVLAVALGSTDALVESGELVDAQSQVGLCLAKRFLAGQVPPSHS